MNYAIRYGVNNSHLTETEFFTLYRDAVTFYKNIDATTYPVKACIKMHYGADGFVCERETKLYTFEANTDNTYMLDLVRTGTL